MRQTPPWESLSSTEAEQAVATALARQGWSILARNLRGIGFEVDLVARKEGTLAIIEVKARRREPPDERVMAGLIPPRKQRSLRRGADAVMTQYALAGIHTVRFDLAVVCRGRIAYFAAFM